MAIYFQGFGVTIQASAHGATAGFAWILNPVGSGKRVNVLRVDFLSQLGSALATAVATVVTLERMTFTGTSSASAAAFTKQITADPTPAMLAVGATTGITPTAGGGLYQFYAISGATPASYASASQQIWAPQQPPVLVAGEGIVVRQASPGVTSDTRAAVIGLVLEEVSA